jgi:DNA-binding NarL/FixJ family response regulator
MSENERPIEVVLIEDHDEYRRSLQSLLHGSGEFRCTAFGEAEAALQKLEELKPDVVVMDINLPGISGIAATRTIKDRWPKVQVMMCTVYEDDDKIFDALKAGATGYLLKRAPIEELFDGIKQVLLGGSPMTAGIARKVVSSFRVQQPADSDKLSERELQVLEHLSAGLRMKEIADRLNLSTNTIRTHVRHIYEKLQVQSRTEALNKMRGGRTGL